MANIPPNLDREPDVISARGYAFILTDPFLRKALLPEVWFRSPYEVLDYRSRLVIHDTGGMRATVSRHQRIRFLQEGVTAILDHTWGDGIAADYANTAGDVVGTIKDEGRRHVIVGLKRRMHRGETLDFEVRREVMAGLTTETGWLETTIDHPVTQLGVEVVFPKDRPYKRATLTAGVASMPVPIAHTRAGASRLQFAAQRPGRDVPYRLAWSW